MLEVSQLEVSRSGHSIISNVSFSLSEGQWLMVCGPNGAGKSTITKAIAGQYDYQGKVLFKGQDLKQTPMRDRAKQIAFLEQHHGIDFDYSVEEIVALGRYAHMSGWFKNLSERDYKVIDQVIEQTGLENKRNQSMLSLSGGEVQRAFLAQVLAQEPDLLILDEPSNHLDLVFEKELFEALIKWLELPGRAILSVVHDLSLACKFGSHALLLDKGKVRQYNVAKEVFLSDELQSVYQMDVPHYLSEKHAIWSHF